MILLQSTDVLRLVLGAAISTVTVNVSWVDLNVSTGAVTPGGDVLNVTSSGNTTIVGSPTSGLVRNVTGVAIANVNNSTSVSMAVEVFDGATAASQFPTCVVGPGERITLNEAGDWKHFTALGAEYSFAPAAVPCYGPTGAIAETFPRWAATTNNAIGASGTLYLQSILLTAGQVVSYIGMFSATTAAATTSNLFFALYSSAASPALLAQSANQGAYTWAATSSKELAMVTPYTVPVSGLYYVGVLQVATTIASLVGGAGAANSVIRSTAPILSGNSTTGLTNALPGTAAALNANTTSLYAWVR